jgi:hypothetical protein
MNPKLCKVLASQTDLLSFLIIMSEVVANKCVLESIITLEANISSPLMKQIKN